jgi:hypothetical protein
MVMRVPSGSSFRTVFAGCGECLRRLEVPERCICGSSSAPQNQRKAKEVIDADHHFCVSSQDEKTPPNRRLHCLLHHQRKLFSFLYETFGVFNSFPDLGRFNPV